MAEATTVPDIKAEFPTFGRMAKFSPGMYSIHWDNLKNIPLKLNGEPSTLDAVYVKFVNSKIKDEPDEHSGLSHKRYVTDEGNLDIEAEWTVLSTIATLAGLFKRGINPINVFWFYFDHDWSQRCGRMLRVLCRPRRQGRAGILPFHVVRTADPHAGLKMKTRSGIPILISTRPKRDTDIASSIQKRKTAA
jgi:hypothetical protein